MAIPLPAHALSYHNEYDRIHHRAPLCADPMRGALGRQQGEAEKVSRLGEFSQLSFIVVFLTK